MAKLPGELRLECQELEIDVSQVEEYLKEGYMVINFQPPFGVVVVVKTHCADCGYWAEREKPAFWPF